ncbi:MAG TPA: DJ-1/PfpI family protein [Chloroflexota bacterium]|nr:DJ-1/PfpI family protein [Chloroflexota bacterium]
MARLDGSTIAIVVAHEFEDIELLYPIIRLGEEGAQMIVATLPLETPGHFHTRPYAPDKPVTGRFGATVPLVVMEEGKHHTHRLVTELKPSDFDALMFPGGFSPDFLRIHQPTLQLVADAYAAGKVIAAICHGPQVLISADRRLGTDLVRGRRVTGYVAIEDDLRNAGGEFVDVGAVRAGNVVTGRCPDDLAAFCHEITEALVAARQG